MALRADSAHDRQGQSTGTGAGLEHARAGVDVGRNEDRPQVLWIDRLRLAPPARHLLRERWPDCEQARAELSADDHAFRATDQVIVRNRSGVERVALPSLQLHAVAPADLVDEQHEIAFREHFHSGRSARIKQCQYACHNRPSRRSGCSWRLASPEADSSTSASSLTSGSATAMLPIQSSKSQSSSRSVAEPTSKPACSRFSTHSSTVSERT